MIRILAVVFLIGLAGCAKDDGWHDQIFGDLALRAPIVDGGKHAESR